MNNIIKIQFLLLLLFLPLVAFSQMEFSMQSSDVLKKNHVSSMKDPYRTIFFDTQGRTIEVLINKKKINYLYNQDGKLIQKTDSFYTKSGKDKIIISIKSCEYKYENNNLTSCECRNRNNMLISKSDYLDNGKKIIEKQFRCDSLSEFSTTLYDSLGSVTHRFGYTINNLKSFVNGKEIRQDSITNWDGKYINEYQNKRLLKQTIYINGDKLNTIEFIYNKKGLLIERRKNISGSILKKKYKYKYRRK